MAILPYFESIFSGNRMELHAQARTHCARHIRAGNTIVQLRDPMAFWLNGDSFISSNGLYGAGEKFGSMS
jgi:hypothetical protein